MIPGSFLRDASLRRFGSYSYPLFYESQHVRLTEDMQKKKHVWSTLVPIFINPLHVNSRVLNWFSISLLMRRSYMAGVIFVSKQNKCKKATIWEETGTMVSINWLLSLAILLLEARFYLYAVACERIYLCRFAPSLKIPAGWNCDTFTSLVKRSCRNSWDDDQGTVGLPESCNDRFHKNGVEALSWAPAYAKGWTRSQAEFGG